MCPVAREGVSPPGSAPPHSSWFPLRAKVPFPAPCCSRVPGLRQRWRGRRDLLPAVESKSGGRPGACSEFRNFAGCLAAACGPWKACGPSREPSPQWGQLATTGAFPFYHLHPLRLSCSHSLESSVCPGGDGSNRPCLGPNFPLAGRLTTRNTCCPGLDSGHFPPGACWIFLFCFVLFCF